MNRNRLHEFCMVIFGLAVLGVIWALVIAAALEARGF